MSLSLFTEGEPVMDAAPPDLAALARSYGRTVFLAAYRVLGDASQAEDVQQEVFLRLLEKPAGEIASWPAYLATMAVRMAIDRLRSRQRWKRLLPMWRAAAPAAFDSTELDALQRERASRLRMALTVLKPREAECFTLRYVQGMEIAAIAQATGMTPNHVGVCLHRAARALETRLGDAANMTSKETL
jgi:RNA polymerase sigma-70 factor (ECF subfamily)